MKINILMLTVLLASLMAGCAQQQNIPEPEETTSPTPQMNDTEEQQEPADEVDNLESNITDVENLLQDLQETEEVNFNI